MVKTTYVAIDEIKVLKDGKEKTEIIGVYADFDYAVNQIKEDIEKKYIVYLKTILDKKSAELKYYNDEENERHKIIIEEYQLLESI